MPQTPPSSSRHLLVLCAGAILLTAAAACAATPPQPLTNAALRRFGTRVSAVEAPGGGIDRNTTAADTFDGNPHTRCVFWGLPYSFTIDLPARIPVTAIQVTDTDYEAEMAPKEVRVRLDDGTTLNQTMELKRPVSGRPAWQMIPVGREAKTITFTVLSNYEGKVNWGGPGDIAVLTTADMEGRLKIPGYSPDAPVYVDLPPVSAEAVSNVHLPPTAALGEHPRLLLTPSELAALKVTLRTAPRGKAPLKTLLDVANGMLTGELDFPDPKGTPAQLTDRSDQIAHRHDILSRGCGTLGLAYALTGDKRYADRAAEILRGYADRYAAYPEHKGANRDDTGKVMAQKLSEAMWLIPLIEGYDYIYNSGSLRSEDHQAIEQNLFRPAIAFIRRADPAKEAAERDRELPGWRTAAPAAGSGGHVGNWLNYYNAATMMAGAVMGDKNMMDLAAADFRTLIANGITPDGLWNEGAIGYQFFALTALAPGLETAARQGIDLWSFDHNRVKMLFDSPLRYAYPDDTAPGIGDSERVRFGDWSTMIYDYASLRFGDPRYNDLVNRSPRQLQMSEGVYFPTRIYDTLPPSPQTHYPSTVFTSLGYAILRNDRTYSLLDYGPFGGTHGHYDKLNLILYASAADGKGDEMGGEPVFHRYEDRLHDEWTVQTVAHNTMAVDESSQAATGGKLLVFKDGPAVQVMRAECATAYPGVLLDRTVVVTPDVVLDVYSGRSASSHTWDCTFRFHGALAGMAGAGAGARLGSRDGYQHILALARHPAVQGWAGAWRTTVDDFQVTLAGAPGQEIILAKDPDGTDMALARQQGENANFAAAYTLRSWKNPVVRLRALPGTDPVAYEITRQDGSIARVFVAHSPVTWKAAGWKSDARVLYVRQKGGQKTVFFAGGTFARER